MRLGSRWFRIGGRRKKAIGDGIAAEHPEGSGRDQGFHQSWPCQGQQHVQGRWCVVIFWTFGTVRVDCERRLCGLWFKRCLLGLGSRLVRFGILVDSSAISASLLRSLHRTMLHSNMEIRFVRKCLLGIEL